MADLKTSKTKENLMRAFAGESQARNRYTFAGEVAKKENLKIIQDLFDYTANQEKAHAQEFMEHLQQFSGEEIIITGTYPAEYETSTLKLLRLAEEHENAEHVSIYAEFGDVAKKEGFEKVATLFKNIASIEAEHASRFKRYADRLQNGTLFKEEQSVPWMCTNCGFIYEGISAPLKCPVCGVSQDYFIRFSESNFE